MLMAKRPLAIVALLAITACAPGAGDDPGLVPLASVADLGLDGPVVPLADSIAIGSLGPVSNRLLCSETSTLLIAPRRQGNPPERRCLRVTSDAIAPEWRRFVISAIDGRDAGMRITFERSSGGEVRALDARHPLGALTASEADALAKTFTRLVELDKGWPRGRVAPGDTVEQTAAMPTDAASSGTVSIRVRCRVLGRGALGGEDMVVIACEGTGPVSHRYGSAAATMQAEMRMVSWSALSVDAGETRRSTSQLALVGRLVHDIGRGPYAVSLRTVMTTTLD